MRLSNFKKWMPGAALLLAFLLLGLFVWGGNQPQAAGLFPAPWDKLAHVAWFATLAGLLVFGLRCSGIGFLITVALACMALGVWDEWRQIALPGRNFGLDDLLADGVGIVMGVILVSLVRRARFRNFVARE
jgi:VanZ family protein